MAASAPTAPGGLARLLIQEFQHVKLGAILDLYDLYDQADDRLFPAPWGEGKAQIEGLLQGAYAHLAVTDFWRASRQRTAGPGLGQRTAGSAVPCAGRRSDWTCWTRAR